MNSKRWSRRPQRSNWGEFGPDDELGRLNLITPEVVLKAVAEVRSGLSLCLSLPLNLPGGNILSPHRHPPRLAPTLRDGRDVFNFNLDPEARPGSDVLSDDAVLLHTQYSTQWDSFAHVGQLFDLDGTGEVEPAYYNGFRGGTDIVGPSESSAACANRLGIERFAEKAIQSRGLLLDLHAICGNKRVYVGYDTLMRALEHAGVEPEPGDILCLYTGFADLIVTMNGTPDREVLHNSCAVLDGRDKRLLEWIVDSGVAAICADNYAVEGLPSRPDPHSCARLPLHQLCLFQYGIALGELWYFKELARALADQDRARFLLTAPPLRLPGAVGSPVTPVATL